MDRPTQTPAPPRRVQRLHDRRRRFRRIVILALVGALVVGLLVVLVSRSIGGDEPAARERGQATGPPPTELTVLAVRTGREPLVAVIGSGGEQDPAAIAIPASMIVNLPGQGEARFREAVDQPADYLGLSVANLLGTRVDHVVVLDLGGLAALVDRAGGALVGGAPHSGREIADSFAVAGGNRAIRWHEVLESLLGNGIELEPGDPVEASDAVEAARALAAATGAFPESFPTIRAEGGLLRADDEGVDRLVTETFGRGEGPSVPLIVLNGTGSPGLGEALAERLVPEGFRIVVSQNAARFNHGNTQIVVTDESDVPTGERIRELLGVGTVVVSGVPSGLADVTIVLGRDYRAE